MSARSTSRPATLDLGLLLLRFAVGGTLVAHGLQKLLVFTLPGVAGSFAGMGIPLPEVVAPAVAAIELIGGSLIVLGIGTRVAGLLAAAAMLGAVFTAHAGAGFFATDGGFELPLLIACAAVALALTGPGRLSVHTALLRGRAPLAA
ncbi:hypothetical protein LLS1_24760 [Leifsonia sp. LS1]|uniref:DoxX family protein n=1 Tax=Leifsonia sp. LS1 TaxID=2828483 RepID=UPI001CFC644A|nr:DoxX family protein [Leifsonia sp. LS1]GIT80807.1 hypothetical protein LLS1_24760 [Leifsonia sp. LS1]